MKQQTSEHSRHTSNPKFAKKSWKELKEELMSEYNNRDDSKSRSMSAISPEPRLGSRNYKEPPVTRADTRLDTLSNQAMLSPKSLPKTAKYIGKPSNISDIEMKREESVGAQESVVCKYKKLVIESTKKQAEHTKEVSKLTRDLHSSQEYARSLETQLDTL